MKVINEYTMIQKSLFMYNQPKHTQNISFIIPIKFLDIITFIKLCEKFSTIHKVERAIGYLIKKYQ